MSDPIVPDLSIITPWLDHPEFIGDYERAVSGQNVEVIVVDNGSAKSNAAALQEMVARLRGKYIRNETNRWFSAANNQGLAFAQGGVIVFLNNDIAGDQHWLSRVASEVSANALYGPELLHIDVDGKRIDYLMGWCVAGTRQVWNTLSGWDERAHSMPYWEDKDLGYRAARAGIKLVQTEWPLRHKGQGTCADVPGVRYGFMRVRQSFLDRVRGLESSAPSETISAGGEFDEAMTLYRSGRLPEAELAFKSALEHDSAQPQMWQQYGLVLYLSGRHEAAVEALRRAIVLQPDVAEFHVNLGIMLARLRRHDEAVEALRAALVLNPQSPQAHNNLSRALLNQGNYQEAERAARQALQLQPGFIAAQINLSRALTALGRAAEAVGVASTAIATGPREAGPYVARAEALQAMGRLAEALASYDQALQVMPTDAAARKAQDALRASLANPSSRTN